MLLSLMDTGSVSAYSFIQKKKKIYLKKEKRENSPAAAEKVLSQQNSAEILSVLGIN